MANTVRNTATNTFTKGLIMDFDPTVTQNDRLVNALNATLLTFNGNEMTLQQDMGNGRVETAFLPEGYVPVGTCEFGDIIYIVSYNPLENKSQIGCFPSPERNITSDEVSDIQQDLENADFQQEVNDTITGVLNATSVKKIVYGNNNMNPGDRYVIYEEDSNAEGGEENKSSLGKSARMLSDYGNTSHKHDTWPKLLKLSVVSIEDSGKIVDLNASVKWYDNDYYIAYLHNESSGTPDLDSYRSLVSSAYSVFQSKVSGKLAILAELETIDGFSCTYDVYIKNLGDESTDDSGDGSEQTDGDENTAPKSDTEYHIYFYTSWETSHNDVNPSGFLLTKSAWTTEEYGGMLYVPEYDEENDVVRYEYQDYDIAVPKKSALSKNENSEYTYWDANQVHDYQLLYHLGGDAETTTFETYISELSYNAQIDDIVDWKKEGSEYTALSSGVDISKVRLVTKATRMRDPYTGEPLAPENPDPENPVEKRWSYVYNADSIKDGEYYTKLKDGSVWGLNRIYLEDDVMNNHFKKDIPTLITDSFELPRTVVLKIKTDETDDQGGAVYEDQTFDVDLSKMVWNYEVAPVMPYGVLDYMAVAGQIDFSKLGSGLISLTDWRYYNSGDVSTLTWGLEVYPEANKGVAEVVFDFFDNQGYAASWHTSNKTSYSGTFTDTIILNQKFSSYKMNITDATGNSDHIHAGEEAADGPVQLTTNNRAVPTGWENPDPETFNERVYGTACYEDNAGMLVSNALYLVKITVKYCTVDLLDNYNTDNDSDFRVFYRWYWTNGMLNESYYSVRDFDVLIPRLELDFSATFDTMGKRGTVAMTAENVVYEQLSSLSYSEIGSESDYLYKTVGANVYAVNQDRVADKEGNIAFTVEPYITEAFNTFNIADKGLTYLNVSCALGESSITRDIESPSLIHTGNGSSTLIDDSIQPVSQEDRILSYNDNYFDESGYISNSGSTSYGSSEKEIGDTLRGLLGVNVSGKNYPELYDTPDAYSNYIDAFSLNFAANQAYKSFVSPDDPDSSISYGGTDGSTHIIDTYSMVSGVPVSEIRSGDNSNGSSCIKLVLAGTAYHKLYAQDITQDKDSKVLRSVIHNASGELNTGGDRSAQYSPQALGLHLSGTRSYSEGSVIYDLGNHMYFNDIVAVAGGKTRLHEAYFAVKSIHNNVTSRYWYHEDESEVNEEGVEGSGGSGKSMALDFDDKAAQDLFAYAFNTDSSVSGFLLIKYENGSKCKGAKSIKCSRSLSKLRTGFKSQYKDTTTKKFIDNETDIPHYNTSKWINITADGNTPRYFVSSFMVMDASTGTYVPFADYFLAYLTARTVSTDGNRETQERYSTSGKVNRTLADMLGSLFSQLYCVDKTAVSDIIIIGDFTYLQNYIEYWNKDMIVTLTKMNSDDVNVRDIITIGRQLMADYLKFLLSNSETTDLFGDLISTHNVDIDLYEKQRVIQFQFAVPYDIESILTQYEKETKSRNIIYTNVFSQDEVPAQGTLVLKPKEVANSVTDTDIYTYESDGSVALLGNGGSPLYFAEEFMLTGDAELCMIRSDETINSNGVKALKSVLGLSDDGKITWSNLSQLSGYNTSYDITWEPESGQDHHTRLGNLPNISIFKLYNPS